MRSNVWYRCACAAAELDDAAGSSAPSMNAHREDFESARLRYSALEELYFCSTCQELRCNDCVSWEAACYYCPSCLFEVPATNVGAQRGECMRSCFVCPSCACTLMVHGSDVRGVALTRAEASIPVAPFYLACPSCRWDSTRVGITFDTQSVVIPRDDVLQAEFIHLQRHWAPIVRRNISYTEKPSVPSAQSALSPLRRSRLLRDVPGITARHIGLHATMPPPVPEDAYPEYAPKLARTQAKQAAREERRWTALAQREVVDGAGGITTLAQRFAVLDQPYESDALRPQRVRLHAKLTKRCAQCRHILVRPEPRASSSRYKLRLLARDYVPNVRVATEPDSGGKVAVAFHVVNPRDRPLEIKVWFAGEPVIAAGLGSADDEDRLIKRPTELLGHGMLVSGCSVQVAFSVERAHLYPLRVAYGTEEEDGALDAVVEIAG